MQLLLRLAQLTTGAVFYFVICNALSRKMSYKGEYHIGPRQLTSAFFIGILFMFQAALLSSREMFEMPASLAGTVLIGQFYFLTLLYFQTEVFKKSAMQKEMDTLNLLYERQREQYQVARQNVQIINKRCHELKLQIAALRQMSGAASDPPDPELKAHIDEAEKAAQLYDASRNTGNEVLDVVLTEKSLLCESRRIQLNAVTDGSCLGFFEAGDLYALFANMLDHAIESAVQVCFLFRYPVSVNIIMPFFYAFYLYVPEYHLITFGGSNSQVVIILYRKGHSTRFGTPFDTCVSSVFTLGGLFHSVITL